MTRYERVTYRPDGQRPRTVNLEVTGDSDLFLRGFDVDRHGERVPPVQEYLRANNAIAGDVMHLIDKAAIVSRTRLEINLHYGELEVAK